MDPYKVLGIEPGALPDEIKRAYQAARKKHHPDAGGDTWAYQLVKDAYQELTSGGSGNQEEQTPVASPVASESAGQAPTAVQGPSIELDARTASTAVRKKRKSGGVGIHIIGAVGGSMTALLILFVAMQNGWLDGLAWRAEPAIDDRAEVTPDDEPDSRSGPKTGNRRPPRPIATPRPERDREDETRPRIPRSRPNEQPAVPTSSPNETPRPRTPMPPPGSIPVVTLPPEPLVESLQSGFVMRKGPAISIRPTIAGTPNGHFVVCWPGTDSAGVEDDRLQGILFPAEGKPVLIDAQDIPLDTNSAIDVGIDHSGAFVAVWAATTNRPQGTDICVLRFDASGAVLDKSFVINTFRKNAQTSPSVGVDDEGNALVAWMSRLQKSGGGWGIYGQAFDSGGEAIGKEFEIADFTNPRRQGEPHVCFRPNGRPLISVTNTAGNPSGIAMYGYDRQGNRRESPIFLRPDGDYQLGASRCAISTNGRLGCVVWQVKSPGDDQWDVLANLFSERGLLNKQPFFVNQTKAGDQVNPGVAFASNNSVLFTWEGAGDGDDAGVFARYFEKDGTALTDELQINDASEGFQGAVDLAVSADRHLVTWVSRGPDAGIFIRDIAPLQFQAPADE